MRQFLSANCWWLLAFGVCLMLALSPARTWIDVSLGERTLLRVATE